MVLDFGVPVQAAEKQDGNVRVDYTIEKTSENEAVIKIQVENISEKTLKNVVLDNQIPKEFETKGETKFLVDEIKAGEIKTFSSVVMMTDSTADVKEDEVDTSKDIEDDINAEDEEKHSSEVDTGDHSKAGVFLVTLIISAFVVCSLWKMKKKGAFFSLILIAVLALGFTENVKAKEALENSVQLKEQVSFNGKEYTFSLEVSYDIEEKTGGEDPATITRGEWINQLVTAMKYEELEVDIEEPYFTDTDGTSVEKSINYAVVYGIVDTDEDTFKPDELASREFIAITTVKALGFLPQEELNCADSSDISDLKNAYMAVELDVIDLEDNYFYPLKNGTAGLAKQALSVVEAVLAAEEVSETPTSEIVYRDNVILLSNNEAEVEGDIVTINTQQDIKVGDIISVADEACYKVTEVKTESGKTVATVVEAQMQEAIESMKFEGELKPDFSQFEPAEGVTVELPESRTYSLKRSARGVTTPDIGEMPFEISIPGTDHVKVKGKLYADVTVTAKGDVELRWDWPPVYCKDVMLKLDPDLDVEAGIYIGTSDGAIDKATMEKVKKAFNNGNRCKGTINLGKVPVVGIPGVRIYLEFGLQYDLNGYFKVVWNYDGQVGFQVYKNNPRMIYSATSTVTPQFGGEAKIGPEVAGVLKTVGYDLIDISTAMGAKGEGEIVFRPNDMICSDLGAHLYWDISALKNSKLGEWFNWGWSKDIWDKNNSPLKLYAHWEDWTRVPECTYADATINGSVIDAETGESISGATVKAINLADNSVETTVTTNNLGAFTIGVTGGVEYNIQTSKEGYITCKEDVKLETDEVRQLQTRMQVKGTDGTDETGKAGGTVKNAQTGDVIDGVTIKARKNWGNKTGEVVGTYTSNNSGAYKIENLILGNYTLEFSKENYVTGYLNICVTKSGSMQQHISLNPKTIENDNSELRVVLTWGANPSDIDSHMIGLSSSSSKFHVYYQNKQYYENGKLICDLDVDDTTSFGPETITLYKSGQNNEFSFYLHDYSNKYNTSSTALSNSGATLTIYVRGAYNRTIYIPTNQVGTQWHAFNYNSETGKIQLVNTFSNNSDAGSVGN